MAVAARMLLSEGTASPAGLGGTPSPAIMAAGGGAGDVETSPQVDDPPGDDADEYMFWLDGSGLPCLMLMFGVLDGLPPSDGDSVGNCNHESKKKILNITSFIDSIVHASIF